MCDKPIAVNKYTISLHVRDSALAPPPTPAQKKSLLHSKYCNSVLWVAIGPIWGEKLWLEGLSGIRTQSGQTKVNDRLTA